jgi:hypothetical protein
MCGSADPYVSFWLSCLNIWFTPVAASPLTIPTAMAVIRSDAGNSVITFIATTPSMPPRTPQTAGSHYLLSGVLLIIAATR